MPRQQLTDLSVRALKADGQTDFWDMKTAGFGVRVGPNSKTFVVKVGNRRITIGRYPDISLSEARRKALEFKAHSRRSNQLSLLPKRSSKQDGAHRSLLHFGCSARGYLRTQGHEGVEAH